MTSTPIVAHDQKAGQTDAFDPVTDAPPAARILIIDDTPAIHNDFQKILATVETHSLDQLEAEIFADSPAPHTGHIFVLDHAYQGEQALALMQRAQRAGGPYAIAFVDVRMPPGWDGIETTTKLWALDPELQVVICTAYADYSWEQMAKRLGHTDNLVILKKPFDPIEVLQLAHALARKWSLAQRCKRRLDNLDSLVERRTAQLQQLQDQLRQVQKMEAIGQLTGGVAHDFNNLLAVIRGNTELVLMENPQLTEEGHDCLNQVLAAAERAANLTRQLLAFGRKQVMQSQPLSLNEVIGNLTKMLKRIIGENIQLECSCSQGLPPVQADAGMLEQVLVNLVVNARDAMPRGGRILVATHKRVLNEAYVRSHPESRPGEFICMSVTDTGSGIAPEHLPRIFEPFFTTKPAGKGTGLGLATVYGIVKQHQGWIEVSSQIATGSTFAIFLPALKL